MPWDRFVYDHALRLGGPLRPEPAKEIVLLSVTDELKQWRSSSKEIAGLAGIVSQLKDQGAASIALDLIVDQGENQDFEPFWDAIEGSKRIVLGNTFDEETRLREGMPKPAMGLVYIEKEDDGIIRTYQLQYRDQPSFAMAALLRARKIESASVKREGDELYWEDLDAHENPWPRRVPASFYFDERSDWTEPNKNNLQTLTPANLTAWQEQGMEDQLLGKIVIVGYTKPGSGDIGATPLSPQVPKVAVHAWALNDLIQDTWRVKMRRGPRQAAALVCVALPLLLPTPVALAGSLLIPIAQAATMLKTHAILPGGSLFILWMLSTAAESYRRRKLRESRMAALKASDDPLVGRVLGQYQLVEKLGHGGFATVYKAVHHKTLDPASAVAIKIINPAHSQNESFRKRFLREVRISSQLHHPNIVQVIDSGESEGLLYLTMELLQGRSLRYWLEQVPGHQWDLDEVMQLIEPVIEGVSHAHGQHVLHRDLKPENVMTRGGPNPLNAGRWAFSEVKIVDFGLAFDDQGTQLTQSSELFGTIDYLPPERITGKKDDPRSDQYAIGVIAFEMLAGRKPFQTQSTTETLLARLQGETPSLGEFRKNLPAYVVRAVDKMLKRDSAERFTDLQQALQGLQGGLPES